ncbi:hypothetical protein SIO70_15660 [Chitinophaga sancti]|uniref:hypothetical protein n=1 Tax=Chitinophaga sancti TaxID=1004 RepID=UPI002A76283E|nr:hypothetical protein [Chitinophaga sancti]WPQ66297.1 hypothetical protein SIO70_15660 [Chitinophaga sancti]
MLSACWDASGTLLGSDYRLFKDTPASELARAVKREDTTAIRGIASGNKMFIDFQEPVYGKTLLMLAVTIYKFRNIIIVSVLQFGQIKDNMKFWTTNFFVSILELNKAGVSYKIF